MRPGLLKLAAFALAAALLASCSSSDPEPPTPTVAVDTATPAPTVTPAPASQPAPVRPEARPFPEALRQSSDAFFEQIAAARGTPIKTPVDMFLLTREQARAFYSNTSSPSPGSAPPAVGSRPIDSRQEVYELLGLVLEQGPPQGGPASPPSLQESQIENLISLITGFYSPEHDALYVVDSATGSRSTIVHELTHALQYQYADIGKLQARSANDWDATTALLDVLEGDAVNTEIEILGFSTRQSYRAPSCFTIPAAQRPGTPYVVERELDTWYEDGLCFFQAVAEDLGIEALFANLPTTTEQVLHPEKYFAGEGRTAVTLAPLTIALGPEWRRASGGTFGEFMLQNILLSGLRANRPLVQEAAAGWGGDAWNLYVNDDGRALHTSIAWDTPEDAAEFWTALLASLAGQGAATPPADATSIDLQLGPITWRASLNGATATLLLSNDPAAVHRAAAAAGLPPAP